MHYIILDLEWDSSFFKKENRFINQIIQIGAVKLDESLKIVDTFEAVVKSGISRRVSGRFSRLTGITSEIMLSGMPMKEAFLRYNEWAGFDTVTMSWSNSDLYSIVENEKYFTEGVRFRIEKYLDLQKFVQNEMILSGVAINSQISLANAAEIAGITTENYSLHTAKDDSIISAALLSKYYNEKRFNALVTDAEKPEFYERLCFKAFYIKDINSPLIDKSNLNFSCEECDCDCEKLTDWRFKNRLFEADFLCNKCGKKFSYRVSFRKTYDRVVVKKYKRVIKPVKAEEQENEVQQLPTTV